MQLMQPLISVIVPIYNVEDYLRECVDSILIQTYKNLEIILVDDGSPDKCGEICEEYREIDQRIVVIHKENGGLSSARNRGIEICKGKYISFIDSDDYVSPFFIEILYKGVCFNSADVVTCLGAEQFLEKLDFRPELAKNSEDYFVKGIEKDEALRLMFYQTIANGVQYRLYRKEIFDNIRFPEGYIFEDVATTYKTFIAAKKMSIVAAKLYAYRVRKNSIVRMTFSDKKMVVKEITQKMYDDICKYNRNLIKAVSSRAFAQNYHVFLQVPKDDIKNQEIIWNEMKKYRMTVLMDFNKKVRLKNRIAALVSLGGMAFSYKMGSIYLAHR